MPSFDPFAVAKRLLRTDTVRARRVKEGRNAEIWQIESGCRAYALKRYLRADAEDRLGRETAALGFLGRHGVASVPQIVAADRESNVILLSWLAGRPVSNATESDILACVAFAALLKELSRAPDAAALADAKEACGSVSAILAQIDVREAKLAAVADREPALRRFLDVEVAPRRHALAALRREYPDEFSRRFKTLSPSDFGFHNALRDASGRLAFLDFEYFGWDDPAKLAADFLLHPGMTLPSPLQALFAARMRDLFAEEAEFGRRVAALLPAYRLRWALIMLNPILDAVAGTAHEGADFASAVEMQTGRAKRFLQAEPAIADEERGRHAG